MVSVDNALLMRTENYNKLSVYLASCYANGKSSNILYRAYVRRMIWNVWFNLKYVFQAKRLTYGTKTYVAAFELSVFDWMNIGL